MSGHHVTVEWDGYDGPRYAFTCDEPAEAICRAVWDCGCESFLHPGVDERGPFHELVDGYMTNDELQTLHSTGTRPRHYGTPGGECGHLLFITESGEEGYLGFGSVRLPVDLEWDADDETYFWSPA